MNGVEQWGFLSEKLPSSCAHRAMCVGSEAFLCFCWFFFSLYALFGCDPGGDSNVKGSRSWRYVGSVVWVGAFSLMSGDLGRAGLLGTSSKIETLFLG